MSLQRLGILDACKFSNRSDSQNASNFRQILEHTVFLLGVREIEVMEKALRSRIISVGLQSSRKTEA